MKTITMKKFATVSLSAMMVFSTAAGSVANVHAQDVKEGTTISVGNKVSNLSDLLNAKLMEYYEEGTLRVTKLQENVYQVDEETTQNPADGPTNNCSSMYLILSNETATLIDAGNGKFNPYCSENNMKTILNELVDNKKFQVILTHLHGDHVGLLADNTNVIDPDTNVLIHENDFDNLSQGVKNNYKNITTFKGGQTLDASGYKLFVVDIPGHTEGSNALIDYDKEVIFTGDAIGSGSVWMSGDDDLISFDKGIDNLYKAIKNMKNPIFYCGHRWQQTNPGAHATEETSVGEIGKKYVEEMDALIDDVLIDNYNVNKSFTPSPNNIGIYSKEEKYKDGKFPGIVLSQTAIDNFKEANNQDIVDYKPGVTVVADENSKSGYTAHFVYNLQEDLANKDGSERSKILEAIPEGAEITGVNLVGSFRLHNSYEVGKDRGHSLLDYEPGDFAANVHPTTWSGEWTFENLKQDENGNYTISIPMISGAHYYYYRINYLVPGENKIRGINIDDPKNVSPCRINEENSDSPTGDITHSIVYGKWSEKQGKTPNLDYMTPYEGSNKGTVEYVEYKGTKNEHQDLSVYLPAGYDANRATPYRVIYLSHGAGGNETYWLNQPQGQNVMDHMIAENPDQEAIVVTMDNTLYNWDYYQIGENVINYIIPYIESHYNVSTESKDRAFAGFSMGSMTTTYMAFHHADKFDYFGIFSGCNIGNATFKDGFQYDSSKLRGENGEAYLKEVYENIEPSKDLLNSVIFTQAGNYDTAVHANGFGLYGAYETIRDWGAQYMPKENFIDGGFVYGSHDIYTWAQCLYNFAKDVVWSKDDKPVTPDQPTTPDIPSDVEKPSIPSENGQTNIENPIVKPTTSAKVKTGDDTDVLGLVSMMVIAGGTVCMVKRKKENN